MLAVMTVLLQLALAMPPTPLATLEKRSARGPWSEVVRLHADGSWRTTFGTGKLTADELASFTRALATAAPADHERRCSVAPIREERLTLRRDGVDVSFLETSPCGAVFTPETARVVSRMRELTELTPSDVLFERALAPIGGGDFTPTITVWRDGRWERRDGSALRRGTLAPLSLAELEAVLGRAQLRFDVAAPRCDTPPAQRLRVTLSRGRVVWETPCGLAPDASLRAAIDHVDRLTKQP